MEEIFGYRLPPKTCIVQEEFNKIIGFLEEALIGKVNREILMNQ